MSTSTKKTEFLRTVKFALFSISAGIIQMGSFALLFNVLEIREWVSHLIALILSVLWNFTLNRKYTFHSAANIPIAMLKVACFYIVFAPLSSWWMARLTEPAYGIMWDGNLVEIGTMLINFVTEFLFQRFFVFKNSIDTNIKNEKSEEIA